MEELGHRVQHILPVAAHRCMPKDILAEAPQLQGVTWPQRHQEGAGQHHNKEQEPHRGEEEEPRHTARQQEDLMAVRAQACIHAARLHQQEGH